MKTPRDLLARFEAATGRIAGSPLTERHLSDMPGCYLDRAAYQAALERGDPLAYTVSALEYGNGPGDLHYGLGRILPGRVGKEYYMTKGHLHTWREAAELYLCLSGQGMMLLEEESSGASRMLPLLPNQPVYVPGHTAHRTINVGLVPLVYLGIYPARAGHDYSAIGARSFRNVVLAGEGGPSLIDRASLPV